MKTGQLLIALSSLAFAGAAQPAGESPAPPEMQQMQGKMQDMQALMDKMRKTEDPQQRHALMREHMQSMQQGMAMMNRMQGAGDASAQARKCAEGDTACRMQRLQDQQQMMNQRMGMMQMMMEQMMGRMTQQDSDSPPPKPADSGDHAAHH